MSVIWFNSEPPKSKFAPNIKIPIYCHLTDTPNELNNRLRAQMLDFEQQIQGEELVTDVPRNLKDPYSWTQHWKQHSIFFDVPVEAGEHLQRFPMTQELTTLYHIIRKNYLLFLKELNYPRAKVYIHGWTNVLRQGEFISLHSHSSDTHSYLSGTYYLTTNNTTLDLIDPTRLQHKERFTTKENLILMFPSYVAHESTVYEEADLRISIAFDICSAHSAESNMWRPHHLFDDPATMDGLDMYFKDRTLTNKY